MNLAGFILFSVLFLIAVVTGIINGTKNSIRLNEWSDQKKFKRVVFFQKLFITRTIKHMILLYGGFCLLLAIHILRIIPNTPMNYVYFTKFLLILFFAMICLEVINKLMNTQTVFANLYLLFFILLSLLMGLLSNIEKMGNSSYLFFALLLVVSIRFTYLLVSLLRSMSFSTFFYSFIMLFVFSFLILLNGFFFGLIYVGIGTENMTNSFISAIDTEKLTRLSELSASGKGMIKFTLYLSYIGNLPFFSSIEPPNSGVNFTSYLPYLERLFGYFFSTIFISYLILGELKNGKTKLESGKNSNILFKDNGLAKAIGKELYKLTKDPTYLSKQKRFREKELSKIITLHAYNYEIKNLAGLEYLTSLRELDLRNNFIKDGTKIAHLTYLEKLSISNNLLTDSHFVEKLIDLETLIIDKNYLETSEELVNLEKLTNFSGKDNGFLDISFLQKNLNLRYIDVRENRLKNLPTFESNENRLILRADRNRIMAIPESKGVRYIARKQLILTKEIKRVEKQLKSQKDMLIFKEEYQLNELLSFRYKSSGKKKLSGRVKKLNTLK
ncbi:leucine-rich repeat domain-containing protein [Carnobacterium gallinarum]|uniref:leucine-rich repeat domain-containing protein n=1 Tax=Carnobacterium gallinarum TaxID=2749 RepID=UPI000555A238|nr:hypothetical protein [Carnobacterium gallinarum]